MPAGRERKRAAPFPFALPPMNFHGTGGRGGASLGESLPSAAALLVYVCQRVERANGVNVFSTLPLLSFPGPEGDGFWQIFTIGGGAFGVCMPACREGERTELLFLCLRRSIFPAWGGVFQKSLQTIAKRLVDTCQRDGRGRVLHRFILRFRR